MVICRYAPGSIRSVEGKRVLIGLERGGMCECRSVSCLLGSLCWACRQAFGRI